jgi:hypothetical protein
MNEDGQRPHIIYFSSLHVLKRSIWVRMNRRDFSQTILHYLIRYRNTEDTRVFDGMV